MQPSSPLPSEVDENIGFIDFHLAEPLRLAIEKLAFSQPTLTQIKTIPLALNHHDLLVSAKTGSGKTAAFILPTLQHLITNAKPTAGIHALVLAPTRELARQIAKQSEQLSQFCNLNIALVTGGEDFKQQQNKLHHSPDILIATPGRLLELLEQDSLMLNHISILVLDEADRMLDMGFNDAVLSILDKCNPNRQNLLFSATLPSGVNKIAFKILKNPEWVTLTTLQDSHVDIEQQLILADDINHKQQLLAWLLLNQNYDKAIVFTNTKAQVALLQGPLRGQKLRVGSLHGDLDQKERNRIMSLYNAGEINVLVATDVAARGLDVKGIDLVINFDIPRNGVDYVHRIGRTGRADNKGLAIALVKDTEWNLTAGIERFLKQKFKRRVIEGLEGNYKGPKKLKASGKAAGIKKKTELHKTAGEKIKLRLRNKKNIGKRRQPSNKT
ncbi:MAG: DEAD/DEAH box helicase [Methylococcaceae bacterium]|jgi:superfamily II DNA/RNA helicase